MNDLPNINFKKSSKNPTLDSDTGMYELPFWKDGEYFANIDNFVYFVKAVEKMVRTSDQYSKYIKYLIEVVGLTTCQVLSNVDNESATVEMHHGPMLTLFDYAAIITDYLLFNKKKVNTFIVSDILLEEHYNNNIQIVMLSKTVHELVHSRDIFINLNQAFGDANAFLNKYKQGLHEEQIAKINNYIELSNKYNSFDKHVLDLKDNIKKWAKKIIF